MSKIVRRFLGTYYRRSTWNGLEVDSVPNGPERDEDAFDRSTWNRIPAQRRSLALDLTFHVKQFGANNVLWTQAI
jgi:hypothetical protein